MNDEYLVALAPAWTKDAACGAIADLEIFFVEQGGSSKAARAVCATCKVRPQCLQLALDHYESIGVWGGTTDPERRHLRRAMKADDGRAVVPARLLWRCRDDAHYYDEPVSEDGPGRG